MNITKSSSYRYLGNVLFFLTWPAIWFYAPLFIRVRVIIIHKNSVLLVKNWYGPGSWQLPGGGRKITESSLEAAVREISEELSIDLEANEVSIINKDSVIVRTWGLLYRYQFARTELSKRPSISKSNEILDYRWFSLKSKEAVSNIKLSRSQK